MSKSLLFAAAVALPLAFLSANTIAEEEAVAEATTEVVEATTEAAATEAECVPSEEGVEPVVTCPEAEEEAAPAETEEAAPAEPSTEE